jgi:hypothetical protein
MAWSTEVLSTTASIAKYEAEINNLAGTYSKNCLTASIGSKIEFSNNVFTAASAIHSDGSVNAMTRTGSTAEFVFTVASAEIIEIRATKSSILSFPVINSSGEIEDTTANYSFKTSTGTTFTTYETQNSWQNKIDLAKDMIALKLKRALADKSIYDRDSTTLNVLDDLDDTSMLNIASDNLSLHLIYQDLYNTAQYDKYKDKANDYYNEYVSKFNEAFPLVLYMFDSTGYNVFADAGRLQV